MHGALKCPREVIVFLALCVVHITVSLLSPQCQRPPTLHPSHAHLPVYCLNDLLFTGESLLLSISAAQPHIISLSLYLSHSLSITFSLFLFLSLSYSLSLYFSLLVDLPREDSPLILKRLAIKKSIPSACSLQAPQWPLFETDGGGKLL